MRLDCVEELMITVVVVGSRGWGVWGWCGAVCGGAERGVLRYACGGERAGEHAVVAGRDLAHLVEFVEPVRPGSW